MIKFHKESAHFDFLPFVRLSVGECDCCGTPAPELAIGWLCFSMVIHF